jgi:FkbM family methyltransferase
MNSRWLSLDPSLSAPLQTADGSAGVMIPDLIYDVGMHNGDDTAYYMHRGYRVIAVEANPVLAAEASARFAREVTTGGLTILNIGISGQEGESPFFICDEVSEWSSLDPAIASRNNVAHHEIVIQCHRFSSILRKFGVPYYLKLDIEGGEIHCLRDLEPPGLPRYISFEKTPKAVESLALVHELGYREFKLISQHNYLPVEYPPSPEQIRYEKELKFLKSRDVMPRVARRLVSKAWLRRLADRTRTQNRWVFPRGSSGPFGEGLPGRWQSFDEMVETLERANAARSRKESSLFWREQEYSFWADFHAKREDRA